MTKDEEKRMKRLQETADRYERETAADHDKSIADCMDWREIETPERLLYRMQTLGLTQLAGSALGDETALSEGVFSATKPDTQVSLLERILEENDLISARFLHRGSTVARSVGRTIRPVQGNRRSLGTGFLVAPHLLLTNNHVIATKREARKTIIEFDFYVRQNGQSSPIISFSLDPNTLFVTNKHLDYTLVAVQPTNANGDRLADRGWIPLIEETGKALIGEPVNIIQHPNGRPQEIAIKNNQILKYTDDFVHYRADTEPGSSGSPVFNMQWQLAALHHAGVPKRNENGQILLKDGTVYDGSEENIDQIHWIANEGVRISRIVQNIKAQLDDDPNGRMLFEETYQTNPIHRPIMAEQRLIGRAKSIPLTAPPRTLSENMTAAGLSDQELDRLTPTEIAAIVAELDRLDDQEAQGLQAAPKSSVLTQELFSLINPRRAFTLVAEGDSWFDYFPAGLDIIPALRIMGWPIKKFANAGDTLDDIAWGTDYKRRTWNRDDPQLETTLDGIRRHRPRVVLLSAGGNDIAGDSFYEYINHKESGLPPVRDHFDQFMMRTYFPAAFEHIFAAIWAIDPNIDIVLHGYGYATPDGRGVLQLGNFSFLGPWLRPALTAKGYTDKTEREQIIRDMIDSFNDTLAQLATSHRSVHYLDLRHTIQISDWVNELHLSNSAYRRVARQFDQKLRQIVGLP